ncbi:MAG: hypothetical protein R2939_05700 [Kofleriaceae bacterium]
MTLFVIVVGPQLAATAALVDDTVRHARDASFWGSSALDADLARLALAATPGLGTYLGLAPLAWALLALLARPRPLHLVLAASVAAFVALAYGNRGWLLPHLADLASPATMFLRASFTCTARWCARLARRRGPEAPARRARPCCSTAPDLRLDRGHRRAGGDGCWWRGRGRARPWRARCLGRQSCSACSAARAW